MRAVLAPRFGATVGLAVGFGLGRRDAESELIFIPGSYFGWHKMSSVSMGKRSGGVSGIPSKDGGYLLTKDSGFRQGRRIVGLRGNGDAGISQGLLI